MCASFLCKRRVNRVEHGPSMHVRICRIFSGVFGVSSTSRKKTVIIFLQEGTEYSHGWCLGAQPPVEVLLHSRDDFFLGGGVSVIFEDPKDRAHALRSTRDFELLSIAVRSPCLIVRGPKLVGGLVSEVRGPNFKLRSSCTLGATLWRQYP